MKKFLVLCVSILCAVTVAFMAIYFLASKEVLTLKDSSWNNKSLIINKDYEIDFVLSNAESDTNENNFAVKCSDNNILTFKNDGKPSVRDGGEKGQKVFYYKVNAAQAGSTEITVTFDSRDAEAVTFTLHATVNDGSEEHPFPIFSSSDLQSIGQPDSAFTADKHYKLQNDITAEGVWSPIPGEFTGSLDGNNKKISQIVFAGSDTEVAQAGIFETIGATGKVYNLTIDQARASGKYSKAGIVAITNMGSIYGIDVTGATINNLNSEASINGGLVAVNKNQDALQFGKVSQSTFDGSISAKSGAIIGGIVGSNEGATVGYVYTTANTSLNSDATSNLTIGGLVGVNKKANNNNKEGLVAEAYSLASTNAGTATGSNIGGTIGNYIFDGDKKATTFGCFYLLDKGFASSIGAINGGIGLSDIPADKSAKGIVLSTLDDSFITWTENKVYVAKGYAIEGLKVKENFVSYPIVVDGTFQIQDYSFNTIWAEPTTESTPTLLKTSTQYYPTIGSLLPSNNISEFLDLFRRAVINPEVSTSYRITTNLDGADATIYCDKILDSIGNEISTVDMFNLELGERIAIKGTSANITISNFNIVLSNAQSGFYNRISNANLENITFKPNKVYVDSAVASSSYELGVIAGRIINSQLTGIKVDLSNTEFVIATTDSMNANNNTEYNFGSIAGYALRSTISNCQVISNNSNVVEYKFAASAHANTAYIGGIVGSMNNSRVNNCVVNGLNIKNDLNIKEGLNAAGAIGGIAGRIAVGHADTEIANSIVNNVKLLSTEFAPTDNLAISGYYTGGIVGEITTDAEKTNGNNIYGCQATTTLTGNIVGGAVGSTYGNLDKVYVNTNATGWKVGGIAGYQLNYAQVKNCLIEGTLIQSTIENSNYTTSITNVKDRAEIAGISAVATMLTAAEDNNSAPVMDSCLIKCAFNGTNAYKDSASVKCADGNKFYILSKHSEGVPLIGGVLGAIGWEDDTYKMYPNTASTINIVFQNVNNADIKDRPDISDAEGDFNKFSYDYTVTTLGDDYSVFDGFDSNVWNINKANKTVTLKF